MRYTAETMHVFALVLSLFAFLHAEQATAKSCCAKHGGVNFCDALMDVQVCGDGTLDRTCKCTYKPVFSDSCTVAALYNIYETKKYNKEDLTNLQKKIWWSQCAPWTRKKVYALLKNRWK